MNCNTTHYRANSSSVPGDPTLRAVIERLASDPVSADVLTRARQPLLEAYDNALKSNSGWMTLTARAQSEEDRIDRFYMGKALLQSLKAEDLQATAAEFLQADEALETLVLPAETWESAP